MWFTVTETPSSEVGSMPFTKSLLCQVPVVEEKPVPKIATQVADAKPLRKLPALQTPVMTPGATAMTVMASVPGTAFTWMVSSPVREEGRAAEIDVLVQDETCKAVWVLDPAGVASTWQLVHWLPKAVPVRVMAAPALTTRPGTQASGPTEKIAVPILQR